jgi:hypothetical protein
VQGEVLSEKVVWQMLRPYAEAADWAMAPMSEPERRDFLEICDARYQARSTLLTSQLPVASWHAQIGDPTIVDSILDRLVHNAHRIELQGESMRKKRRGKINGDALGTRSAPGVSAVPSGTPLPGSTTKRLTNADHFRMIRTAQRRFAPTVIGITRNSDRHQFGISDRLRRNPQQWQKPYVTPPQRMVFRTHGRKTAHDRYIMDVASLVAGEVHCLVRLKHPCSTLGPQSSGVWGMCRHPL